MTAGASSNKASVQMRTAAAPLGVSIVICSYNGAQRLGPVLDHLARQDAAGDVPWEIIVVDNASTDDTAAVARRCWPQGHAVPLRVVSEPCLGLAYAKQRGLAEARYELVCFVDDDSWVCPGWVRTVIEVCWRHPEAGAVRGVIEAGFQTGPPWWFESFKDSYGIGPDLAQACDVTELGGVLCGDGLTLRKSAWADLCSKGFRFTMAGNTGEDFNGTEDDEVAAALRLAGWRFWFDPRLRLTQFLTSEKLSWHTVRLRARDVGRSSAALDPYWLALRDLNPSPPSVARKIVDRLPARWLWRALWDGKVLASLPVMLVLAPFFPLEGRRSVLDVETAFSRFIRLMELRGNYDLMVRETRSKNWR